MLTPNYTEIFDAGFYLAMNPDVATAGVDPLAHYLAHGWREGRDPHPVFDGTFYLANNPDVAAAGVDPLGHFLRHGWREGRDPDPAFSLDFYAFANPDVMAAGWNPLVHYIRYGAGEGRAHAPGQTDQMGRILGWAGDDTLTGGVGDNHVLGGPGNDVLTGGVWADQFVAALSTSNTETDTDVIADFDPLEGDQIVFRAADVAAIVVGIM